ncbi:hypothetical protein [Nitrosomonas sp. Is79A3]|uniref:tetratricopeptide repeat protein n=1 Tax=Nitrosomonas sp. (strain Is79A3) TaxID=261292 RepID=UPI00329966C3
MANKDYYLTALKFAKQGDASAQYNLAMMYQLGKSVPQDSAQARSWYRKAAEQGHTSAQFTLGNIYYLGNGESPRVLWRLFGLSNFGRIQVG